MYTYIGMVISVFFGIERKKYIFRNNSRQGTDILNNDMIWRQADILVRIMDLDMPELKFWLCHLLAV